MRLTWVRLEVSRSHRILWLLEELKIPYELKTWKRGADKLADPKLKEVHPLGKSPMLVVERPDGSDLVLIESAAITEYLCDYYGRHLIPKRYSQGHEGEIAQENESWIRSVKHISTKSCWLTPKIPHVHALCWREFDAIQSHFVDNVGYVTCASIKQVWHNLQVSRAHQSLSSSSP